MSITAKPRRRPYSALAAAPRLLKRGAIIVVGMGVRGVRIAAEGSGTVRGAERTLSAAERARMARFHHPEAAERYLWQRLLLRAILAHCMGGGAGGGEVGAAGAIDYRWNRHGKPQLVGHTRARPSGGIHFSLTHSGEEMLVAMSTKHELGIDCEGYAPRRAISAETLRMIAAPRRRSSTPSYRAIIRHWTRREALTKCAGVSVYTVRPWSVLPRQSYALALSHRYAVSCVVRALPLPPPLYYYRPDPADLVRLISATMRS